MQAQSQAQAQLQGEIERVYQHSAEAAHHSHDQDGRLRLAPVQKQLGPQMRAV